MATGSNKKTTTPGAASGDLTDDTAAIAERLQDARHRLGHMWGLERDLTRAELARALGLSQTTGHDHLYKVERGLARFTRPLRILLDIYLSGDALPPDYVEIIVPDRRFKSKPAGEV